MTLILGAPRGALASASDELARAAAIAHDAALALSGEHPPGREADRYRFAADRLSRTLRGPRMLRDRVLKASPAVLEQSGTRRTLVEMMEAEPPDDEARLRLAKLLLRALIWIPETLPLPPE